MPTSNGGGRGDKQGVSWGVGQRNRGNTVLVAARPQHTPHQPEEKNLPVHCRQRISLGELKPDGFDGVRLVTCSSRGGVGGCSGASTESMPARHRCTIKTKGRIDRQHQFHISKGPGQTYLPPPPEQAWPRAKRSLDLSQRPGQGHQYLKPIRIVMVNYSPSNVTAW